MALTAPNHYGGGTTETCSYSGAFAAKHIAGTTSEVLLNKAMTKGEIGVIIGKASKGELKNGTVLFKHPTGSDKIIWDDAFYFVYQSGGLGEIKDELFFDDLEDIVMDYNLRRVGKAAPSVPLNSASVGNMPDQDAAILFVKTKDEIAASKGIPIQGANPALDTEVYAAIAKVTGYSADEIAAKVAAYKASGKKLSSLKKTVLKNDSAYKAALKKYGQAQPSPAIPQVSARAVKKAPTKKAAAKGIETPSGEKLIKVPTTADHLAEYDVYVNGEKIATIYQKYMGATKYSTGGTAAEKAWYVKNGGGVPYKYKEYASEAAKKTAPAPLPKKVDLDPPKVGAVPDHASTPVKREVIKEVKQSVAGGVDYDEEDLVKAFIKAKDTLAADASNAFNLYSKGPQFDEAMEKLIKSWGVDVKIEKVNTAVANYVASGKKVSALKKKMIASGEMDKLAPTLKKTPAEKIMSQPATNSATHAKNQIDEAIKVGDDLMDELVDLDAVHNVIFDNLKDKIGNWKSVENNLEEFYEFAKKKNLSLSLVIKGYDKKKALQLGLDNSNFYEKKIMEYLATPSGKKYAVDQLGKPKTYSPPGYTPPTPDKTLGTLGPDSDLFSEINTDEAMAMHGRQRVWEDAEVKTLKDYTGSLYLSINPYHRQGRTGNHDLDVHTSRMDSAMRPFDKDVILHRGTTLEHFGVTDPDDLFDLIGKTATDKGYMSTSVGGRAAFSSKPVLLEIEAPIGTKGAYVKPISNYSSENELILARGTKMRILQVRKGSHQTTVRVRIVDQDG